MDFKIEADSEFIKIDDLQIAPGEADTLKSAVSFAGGMREFPALPEDINFMQFRVGFYEDGTLTIARTDGSGSTLKFHFDMVDELIIAVNTALGISVDKKRLNPSPRHAGALEMYNTGDIIEGR